MPIVVSAMSLLFKCSLMKKEKWHYVDYPCSGSGVHIFTDMMM